MGGRPVRWYRAGSACQRIELSSRVHPTLSRRQYRFGPTWIECPTIGGLGLRVIGPRRCRATSTVREFFYKNFVPFTWFDTETEAGRRVLAVAPLEERRECRRPTRTMP